MCNNCMNRGRRPAGMGNCNGRAAGFAGMYPGRAGTPAGFYKRMDPPMGVPIPPPMPGLYPGGTPRQMQTAQESGAQESILAEPPAASAPVAKVSAVLNSGAPPVEKYELCHDQSGNEYLYRAADRNPFWPEFAHPRWLCCARLYDSSRE